MATPPPIDHDADLTGGGAPNPPDSPVMGLQISPASDFSEPVSNLRETLMAMISTRGQSTRPVSAGTLMAAEMTRPFDAEVAWEVLAGVMTGLTVLKACELAGVSRSTVYAWRLLRPAFDAALKEARVWLGEYQQELATEEGDPAMMSARLRLAASYDRRIKGGEESEGGGSLTVQVLKLG